MWYVYLLRSKKDRRKYIGSTDDYDRRLSQHNNGLVDSTQSRRPFVLVGYQEFESVSDAALFEKKYKRSHGALERAIKRGDFKIINDGV